MKTYISVKTKEQLKAVKSSGRADEIIVPVFEAQDIPGASGYYLLLPDVLRENKRRMFEEGADLIRNSKGVVIQNADEIGFLKSIGFEGEIIGGELLYSYNSRAVNFYLQIFPNMNFIAPAELTDDELARLEEAADMRFIYKVYGRQKLMTTAQYLNGPFTDEKGEKFIAVYDDLNSLSEIYTSKPVSMLDKNSSWRDRDILFDFTCEDVKDIHAIFDNMNPAGFIRGHHFKGID